MVILFRLQGGIKMGERKWSFDVSDIKIYNSTTGEVIYNCNLMPDSEILELTEIKKFIKENNVTEEQVLEALKWYFK